MADGSKDAPLQATRVDPVADVAPAVVAAETLGEKAPVAADVPAAGAAATEVVEAKPELTTDKPSLLDSFEKPEVKAEDGENVDGRDKPGHDGDKKPADADAKDGKGDKDPAPADKDAAKPDGEKPAADAKPEAKDANKDGEPAKDAAAAEPAKPEPIAYEYALPETIKLDDTLRTELHTALDGFRADPAKGAQALLDLHAKAMTDYATQLTNDTVAAQHKAFNDTRSQWQKDVLADEEIGGAGHQTSMRAIARMRDLFVPEKERGAFDQFLRVTGAGDHPQFLKLLHQAARYIDEPSMPPAGVRPPPNNGKAPGRRRDAIYDHPSSQKQRS